MGERETASCELHREIRFPLLPDMSLPRILVVDDDNNTPFLRKKELIEAEYVVTTAAKAAELFNHIETASYVGQCWAAGHYIPRT